MTGTSPNPALDALGDRLEQAAGTAIATGAVPGRGRWARVAFVPALALFVVAGVLIATLVPGGGGQSAEAAVISAAQATTDASTGRFRIAVSTSVGGADDLGAEIEGAYDLDAGRYRTTMSLGSALGGAAGTEMLGDLDLSVETVIDGDDAYVHLGPAADLFGAEWLHVTVPDLAGQQAAPLVDPGSFLDSLEGVADLDEVGREAVRGVDTTHYRGAISLDAAYGSLSAEDRAELESGLGSMFDSLDLGDLPVEVWVGDDGLVRRMDVAVDAGVFGVDALAGVDAGVSVTIEFFDIGEPVEIPLPPADEVASMDDLVTGLFSDLEGALGDLDLGSLGEDLEGLLGDLDPEGMLDELEEFLDGVEPPAGVQPDPGPPSQPGRETTTTIEI